MNCEFQSMQIAQEKLSVTRDLQKAAQDYQSSLNATKLIWDVADDLGIYDVSYDVMMTPTVLNEFDPYLITDKNGRVVLTQQMFDAAVNSGIIDEDGNPTGMWKDSSGNIVSRETTDANPSGQVGAGPFEELTRTRTVKEYYQLDSSGKKSYYKLDLTTGKYELDSNGRRIPVTKEDYVNDPAKYKEETVTKDEVYGYKYAQPNRDTANDGSRNAFLYQLGKSSKIDMNMVDSIINLGEAGYTKSGIGGPIFSKTSTNAMNTYAFKEYMKKADYSLRLAGGNTLPEGKSAKSLIYEFNLTDILNPQRALPLNDSNRPVNGTNFVYNPQDLDTEKFVITRNGQALSKAQLEKLTLGDLLDGKYDITYQCDPANPSKTGATTEFEKVLKSMAEALGYNAPADSYVGLNVDRDSDTALSQAYDFTYLALINVTDKSDESSVMKLSNIADEQNNVIKGKDGLYTLSLTNLLKSFLTNFAIGLEGFGSPYKISNESAKESNYVTSDLEYKFLFKNESAMTDTLMLNADFYNMLYNQIATCGACTDKTKQEMVTDNEWLQQQLKRGSLFISSLNNDGYFYQGSYTLNGHVKEVTDENAIARAELEYNVQKSKLNTKEESLELQMKNLDMEISSLTTEYDTVKNLISKGIEKVFTMFST